jgi:hypothetical protein
MNYAIVNPQAKEVRIISAFDMAGAKRVAGLNGVDFGVVYPAHARGDKIGLGIVVYEFGLLREDPAGKPVPHLPLFGFHYGLYAGKAVLYSFDETGETVDLRPTRDELKRDILWLPTHADAERAIAGGLVRRPYNAINDKVLSQWPNMTVLG